jgi:hypothetical protein
MPWKFTCIGIVSCIAGAALANVLSLFLRDPADIGRLTIGLTILFLCIGAFFAIGGR